mgnify:CR=1 FL=1|tara:strand:- start:3651 stop:5552 length:1902 start_codon:yes stop_codon:yes gene_type:complete
MAIGDPINAGIGSYDPTKNYFAQPQRRGAGLLSPSDLNLSTVPGQSQMDALNAIRERLGMRPLDQGLGSKFSIAPTGMTKGQAKQQQMTVGEYDIGRKLAALDRPNTMTQVTSALQDDPGDRFPLADIFDVEGGGGLGGSNENQPLVFSERDPNLDVDIGAAGLGVEPPADSGGSTPSTATTGGAGSGEEAGGLGEANADQALVFSGTSEDDKKKTSTDPFEAALVEAMKDYEDAKAGEDTGIKDIDYYKQKFSEATGIDTSGKVDKSQALMAFGLALMQNKAGKGFDVGNILGAVGAAGEKAMPELTRARSEARAAQLAGGKYALNQIAKDKAAEAAILAEKRSNIQEIRKLKMSALADSALKQQEHENNMRVKRLEISGKIAESAAKSREDLNKLSNEFTGEKDYNPVDTKKNIKVHVANRKSDGAEIFTKPLADVPLIAKGYADSLDGSASIDKMINLITEASQASATGGLAGQQLFEFINNRSAAFGLNLLEDESGKKVGPVTEANAIRERLIAQYKRFLTQETGNGISNTDVERLARSLGSIDFLTNPNEAITKLRETRRIFESSTKAFQTALIEFSDKDRFFNEEIYEKTQRKLQEAATGALYEGLGTESANITTDPDTGVTTIKLS